MKAVRMHKHCRKAQNLMYKNVPLLLEDDEVIVKIYAIMVTLNKIVWIWSN